MILFKKSLKPFSPAIIFLLAAFGYLLIGSFLITQKSSAFEINAEIENALYQKTDFFGVEAIVPFPTAQARENLFKLLKSFPNEEKIYLKLSELDEKLGNFAEAEFEIKKFAGLHPENLEVLKKLADFYNRRAMFEKEAEIREAALRISPPENRGEIFKNLIWFAKKHDLQKYLRPEFYRTIIELDSENFSILEQYYEQLISEKNYLEALKLLRESKSLFPSNREYFLEKEVSILLLQGKIKEAESVYQQSFNPFWSEEMNDNFYQFLHQNDRYRAFGYELRQKFKKNPVDFETGIRLIHYKSYNGHDFVSIILQLEESRARQNIPWKSDELLAVSRFLLADGNGQMASRFLYSLFLQEDTKPGGKLRSKVLYQLFDILIKAEFEQISLAKGNLNFYEDIALADSNPGITTGILSLIFSDTEPAEELESKQKTAVKFFNRAAAHRIFTEYKKEFPTSPELAGMYLDLIELSLLAEKKDLSTASNLLAEFAERYKNSMEFPKVAVKLADAYKLFGNAEKEREILRQILDYLGENRDNKRSLIPFYIDSREINPFQTENDNFFQLDTSKNDGYPNNQNYYSDRGPRFNDHFSVEEKEEITYSLILKRYVSTLAREKNIPEIIDFYAGEISKYPDEQGLYEQFLLWLEQTNFTDEQLKIYRAALKRFPSKSWQDRLARWFIKNERQTEFEQFSKELLTKIDDEDTRKYLSDFIDEKVFSNPESFNSKLYLGLYSLAHERFPHNPDFVKGLLNYYKSTNRTEEYRKLLAKHYFESKELREEFLLELARTKQLREYLKTADEKVAEFSHQNPISALPYKLFQADANIRYSNYEAAVETYRELNQLYPNNLEFSEKLISITRSLGQKDRKTLRESAENARQQADNFPANANFRTRAGEIQAELGNYEKARQEWHKLILTASGDNETYLETATVFWDYFQYDDALEIIKNLQHKIGDETLFAFQSGAIYEAKRDLNAALPEYIKALGGEINEFEDELTKNRAKKRLSQLFVRKGIPEKIFSIFERELQNDPWATLAYAEFLRENGKFEQAKLILIKESDRTDSKEFLEETRHFFSNKKDSESEQIVLQKLSEISNSPRIKISYKLQLADSYYKNGQFKQVSAVLANLIGSFPKNYGVLSETADIYWEMGMREKSIEVLQSSYKRSRGKFEFIFGSRLVSKLIEQNNLASAEKILLELQAKDKSNTEIFYELAKIYVRSNRSDKLRKTAAGIISAIKSQDLEPREIKFQVAGLREKLINVFTSLQDFDAAIEQYIEIINREPDDSEKVDEAIRYTKRYGGAEKLLNYYLKTAAEAYKNYRWNVVLAQIYEANQDYYKAIENYKIALQNQPEMADLYHSMAEDYAKLKNFEAALASIEKAIELGGQDKMLLTSKIKYLENAGRKQDAENEKQQLPKDEKSKPNTLQEQFTEASNLRSAEKTKAIEIYRHAFQTLYDNPTGSDIKTSDIIGYAETLRQEDNLTEINQRLWNLREKVITEIENSNSINTNKARNLLHILDGSIPEAIGKTAKQYATGQELSELFTDFEEKIKNSDAESDKYQTLSLLQNLILQCGFGALVEKILITRKDKAYSYETSENFHFRLRELMKFYEKRGDFRKILEILEFEKQRDKDAGSFQYDELIAENAGILGYREKQLNALRTYFQRPKVEINQKDDVVNRYLEMLYEDEQGRRVLSEIAGSNSLHQLQIINFFLSKNEKNLADQAIRNSNLPEIWKTTHLAESNFAVNDFSDNVNKYFVQALNFGSIGELLLQKRDEKKQLIGDEWHKFAETYGRWLNESSDEILKNRAGQFLPAIIENRPKDVQTYINLGDYYLKNNNYQAALEQFQIAEEFNPGDKIIWAKLGTAQFHLGHEQKADEILSKIISVDSQSLADCKLYLETLSSLGQADKAQKNLEPLLNKFVEELRDKDYLNRENASPNNEFPDFLRFFAATFNDDAARSKYLLSLIQRAQENTYFPEFIIKESLVSRKYYGEFYEILIKRTQGLKNYDFDPRYQSILETNWNETEAEYLLDQDTNFQIKVPDSEKLNRQKEYLEYLLQENETARAKQLITAIKESLKKKFARPVWLRSAEFQIRFSPQTLPEIMYFVGIKSPENSKIYPPNLARLNLALELLKKIGRNTEAENLLEAFYARLLALQQFEVSTFAGLAKSQFRKGEFELGLKLLNLMIDISSGERIESAQAELASLPLIKSYIPENSVIFDNTPNNFLNKTESLLTAAEISTDFGFFETAIEHRKQLLELSPENTENQLELARLQAHTQQYEIAVENLSKIISDENIGRNTRWQALLTATEIIGVDENLWLLLKDRLLGLKQTDSELIIGAESVFLSKTGKLNESRLLLSSQTLNYQSPYLKFLSVIISKNIDESDLNRLQEIINHHNYEDFLTVFGFISDPPDFLIIRSYLKQNKPLAALEFANKTIGLNRQTKNQNNTMSSNPNLDPAFMTLKEKTEENHINSMIELFGLLSEAAEKVGDLNRAIEYETSKLILAGNPNMKQNSESRISELKKAKIKKKEEQMPNIIFDGNLVTQIR